MKPTFLPFLAALLFAFFGPLTILATSLVNVQVTTLITITGCNPSIHNTCPAYYGNPPPPIDTSKELPTPNIPDLYAANRLQARHCLFDACMQEFLIFSSTLTPICATFTTTQNTCIDPFPLRVSKYCSSLPTKVSSACSCLMASHFPSSVPSSLLSGASQPSIIIQPNNSQLSPSQSSISQPNNSQASLSQFPTVGQPLASSVLPIGLSSLTLSSISGKTLISDGNSAFSNGSPRSSSLGETLIPSGSGSSNLPAQLTTLVQTLPHDASSVTTSVTQSSIVGETSVSGGISIGTNGSPQSSTTGEISIPGESRSLVSSGASQSPTPAQTSNAGSVGSTLSQGSSSGFPNDSSSSASNSGNASSSISNQVSSASPSTVSISGQIASASVIVPIQGSTATAFPVASMSGQTGGLSEPLPSESSSTGVGLPTFSGPGPNPTFLCSPFPFCTLTAPPVPAGSGLPTFSGSGPNSTLPCSPWPTCLVTMPSSTSVAVTSTLTTSPPGFSIEYTSRSDWVSNTWLSTTGSDGQPTLLPVIVGCPGCGPKGSGGGEVLWNLPSLQNVEIQLPGFPKLPRFHL